MKKLTTISSTCAHMGSWGCVPSHHHTVWTAHTNIWNTAYSRPSTHPPSHPWRLTRAATVRAIPALGTAHQQTHCADSWCEYSACWFQTQPLALHSDQQLWSSVSIGSLSTDLIPAHWGEMTREDPILVPDLTLPAEAIGNPGTKWHKEPKHRCTHRNLKRSGW